MEKGWELVTKVTRSWRNEFTLLIQVKFQNLENPTDFNSVMEVHRTVEENQKAPINFQYVQCLLFDSLPAVPQGEIIIKEEKL